MLIRTPEIRPKTPMAPSEEERNGRDTMIPPSSEVLRSEDQLLGWPLAFRIDHGLDQVRGNDPAGGSGNHPCASSNRGALDDLDGGFFLASLATRRAG